MRWVSQDGTLLFLEDLTRGRRTSVYIDMGQTCGEVALTWLRVGRVGEKSETPETSANMKARAAGRDAANSEDTSVTSTDVCSDSNSLHYVSKMW